MVKKLVLDVDTGTDDAVAIMLAALHPALQLVGVTTVNGNVEVEKCTDNSLRILDWIGRPDVPVYQGLKTPFAREDFPVPRALKRDAGVHMDVLPVPEAKSKKQDMPAPMFLRQIFADAPQEITLIATGPLSNLAATLALDPNFASNVKELIIMGGGIDLCNVTAAAEANIWADPEAAAKVLAAPFPKITLVPLDATHQALVSKQDCDRLRALGTPAGMATADLVEFRIKGYDANQPTGAPQSAPVHDALCVAALVDSTLIETRFVNVAIETRGEYTIGATIVDHRHRTMREPNCHVAFHADRQGFVAMLEQIFGQNQK